MPAMWRSRDKDTYIRCGEAGIEYTHAMRRSGDRDTHTRCGEAGKGCIRG